MHFALSQGKFWNEPTEEPTDARSPDRTAASATSFATTGPAAPTAAG